MSSRKMKMKKMKPLSKEEMKVGRIYRNVARHYFECLALDDLDYESIITRGDLSEIEDYVKIRDIFTAMAGELDRVLSADKIKLPSDFADVITYSEEPEFDLEEITIEIGMRKFSKAEKAVIALKVLKAVHDEWVHVNSDKFFSDNKKDKCKFLQFELLGPDEVKKHCIFTDEVFTMFGLQPDGTELTWQYWRIQKAFLDENGISSRDSLIGFIMKADYNPLSRDICDLLRTDRSCAEIMADN